MDSVFVRHENCPYCSSRDNLARYDDGHGYCFGCHYTEPATEKWLGHKPILKALSTLRPLPEDAKPQLGATAWTWLKKYGIMEDETQDFLWSDEKQWLIFTCKEITAVTAWQARNFNKERPKPKYLTYGPISDILVEFGKGEVCVVTEDVISALKVARSPGVVGVPLFGSNMPLKTLTRLARRFKTCGIWLDSDKSKEAVTARSRASQFFPQVFTILSTKDPKDYREPEITEKLCNAMEV